MRKISLLITLLVAMVTTTMAQEGITISPESNLSQTWTSNGQTDETGTYSPWGTDVITEYPSGITPTSGNEVHMATTENVTISELGRLKFTFQFTTGDHRLNILGVDLLSGEEVIASDYHNGQTGGNNSNNTYTFVAPAGTYTLRYFVEHSTGGNDLRRTNGNITATLTNVENSKTAAEESIESFRNINMFVSTDVDDAKATITALSPTTAEQYISMEETCLQAKYGLMATINGKCFTLQSFGRSTTNGRYLGVTGLNLDGTMNIVATDANELKNIWKFEYVSENKFRLLNIAYDVYAKPIGSFNNNKTITTTSSQEDAGLYLINPQSDKVALGDREGDSEQYFLHETDWSGHDIVRWTATAPASQWAATEVEEPELCSITYNYTLDGVNFRTEKLNVTSGSEYTFVNNYTAPAGMSLSSEVPAAATITEDQVVNYEYVTELPFEAAAVSNNRLAQGSKLYKIKLNSKNVQLNSEGTGFNLNQSDGNIENLLFAFVGTPLDNWQMFNYAAGFDKPVWAAADTDQSVFVPTSGATGKLELMKYVSGETVRWSFRKSGTTAYINDYANNGVFAVWNDSEAYTGTGSSIEFTEATEKEVSIATLNIDIKAATPYTTNELLDATIKTDLTNAIAEATTAIADENSTAAQLNEIDARILQLTQDAANDLVVQNAEGFKNDGVYTFVNSRGWLLYNSENPSVVASSKAYGSLTTGNDQAHCQWSIHKSANTGSYYMYNVGAAKFVGNPTGDATQIPFVAAPTNTVTFYAGTKSGYPIIVSTNNKSAINNFNHSTAPGVANWNDGLSYLGDDGSCHQVTKVAFLDETTLANITELVDIYESYINKPTLQEKIAELTTFKESSFLTDEEKTTIQTAIDEAQAVYEENEKYSAYAAEITKLVELKKSLQYLWSTDNLSNTICYTVSTNRGAWYSEVAAEVARLNSTQKLNIEYNTSETTQQFAFLKSPNTGNYYIYSVSSNKFVSKSGEYTQLTDAPVETAIFLNSQGDADYPWVIALNTQDGEKQINVSNNFDPAVITFYNALTDDGNRVRLELADTFNPETALAAISAFEISSKKAELLAKIAEANTYSAKEYLPEDKRTALSSAATTAQGVYENEDATYDAVVEQIEIIEGLISSSVYVTTPDGFTNTAVYTIVSGGGAYIMYNGDKTADYAISSPKYSDIESGEAVAGCQWALYTSTSGYHYLYNIGAQKFMGTTSDNNGSIPLNEKPTSNGLIFKNSENAEYPLMFSVNNGTGSLNHNTSFTYGLLNWNSGWSNLTGTNNIHKVTVVGALEDETLAAIEELVNTFETVGIKQLELKTLLDNIYSNYYDAYASGDYKWRINTGVNNYTQAEGDEDFFDAYTDARTYETSEDLDAIQAQIDRMNGLVDNLTINQPEEGKYYRIRCADGMKYLSSDVNDAGCLQMTSSTEGAKIFYYTNGGLVSYAKGVYIYAVTNSNHIKLRGVGETSVATFVDGKDNNKPGSYLINIKNSDDDGSGRWIHGQSETSDSGKNKPTGGTYSGYTWWLEEVTSLPVTVPATGYATFYAPVAVTVPASGVTAHSLVIEGNNAVMSEALTAVPANKGVLLYANGISEATTYNFEINTGEVSDVETVLTGTVAATNVTDDAYVLNIDAEGLVSLNKTTADFENNSHTAYMPATELDEDQQTIENYPIVTAAIGDAIDAFELQIEMVQGKGLCIGTLVGEYTEPDDWYYTAMGVIANYNNVTSATTVDEINGWATQLQAISDSFIPNLPVDGKAYTFKNVQKDGENLIYSWLKYDGTQIVLTTTEAEATPFVCRDLGEGKFAFANNAGKYLIWKGSGAGHNGNTGVVDAYDETWSQLTIAKMTTGSNIDDDQSTARYMTLNGRRNETVGNQDEFNYIVIAKNGGSPAFSQARDPYFTDSYSSAFIIDEVEYSNKPTLTAISESDELVRVDGSSIATFSAPFATIVPDGVTAYVATSDGSDNVVYIEPIEGAIPANQGVILVGDEAGKIVMKPAAGETEATWDGENKFGHSAGEAKTLTAAEAYILAKGDDGIGFYETAAGTLAMNKAYLNIPVASGSVRIRVLGGGVTTEIDEVEGEMRNEKAEIYDLQGRKLNAEIENLKGLYIVNGKKTFVK